MLWNPYFQTAAALSAVMLMNSMAVWTAFTIQAAAHQLPTKQK